VNCLSNVDNLGKTVDKLEKTETVDKLQIMVDNDQKTVDKPQIINYYLTPTLSLGNALTVYANVSLIFCKLSSFTRQLLQILQF
jgi:hypothetical protein